MEHSPLSTGGPDFSVTCVADGLPWPCPDAATTDAATTDTASTDGVDPTPVAIDDPAFVPPDGTTVVTDASATTDAVDVSGQGE